jgi:cation diffusion facilitator family transporter
MGTGQLGRAEKAAIWLGIVGNALLFCGKILVGLLFDSIAIISDSLNSLTDIVASLVVFVSIKSSYTEADAEHPYGHKRAQPIAGLVVAIFTCIDALEVP